jgi:hypothetical protein
MVVANLRFTAVAIGTVLSLGTALASAGGSAGSNQSSRRAQDLLFLSLRRSFEINVVAIVEQRAAAGAAYQFQIQQNESGTFKSTVLKPLSQQGRIVLDNGDKSFTLHPDQRLLVEQGSQRKLLEDAARRQELTLKNYKLALGQPGTVAGRSVLSVVATPKAEGMPVRQFFVDEKTLFPLKVVVVPPNGEPETRLETKLVSYPTLLPDSALGLPSTLGQIRRVINENVAVLASNGSELRQLGFDPRRPSKLPLGFVTQAAEVQRNYECGSFVLRLTDGLSHASVYQNRAGGTHQIVFHAPGRTVYSDGRINFTIYSDLPEEARLRLLAGVAGVRLDYLNRIKREVQVKRPNGSENDIWSPVREPERKPQTLRELSEPSELPIITREDRPCDEEKTKQRTNGTHPQH